MNRLINPPDIAIALNYDGKSAPRVTAKGQGKIAEQILKTASEHNIPLQTDPKLAKILATIPLNNEIPQELYKAVAEVIAFAYILSEKSV